MTRTRNIGYILILAGGGGLASQSPLKGSPALERVHYLDLQGGGEKCSFRDQDTFYKNTTATLRRFVLKLGSDGFSQVLLAAAAVISTPTRSRAVGTRTSEP